MVRKEHRKYTREFKLEAIRLAAKGDRTKAQIARELGIRVNLLRNWRLEFEGRENRCVTSGFRLSTIFRDFYMRMPSSRRRLRF